MSALRPSLDVYRHADLAGWKCPFCVPRRPALLYSLSHVRPHPPFWVACDGCGTSGPNRMDKASAIKSWAELVGPLHDAEPQLDREQLPFGEPRECPKCGFGSVTILLGSGQPAGTMPIPQEIGAVFHVRYCNRCDHLGEKDGMLVRLEPYDHLHLTCRQCGYQPPVVRCKESAP